MNGSTPLIQAQGLRLGYRDRTAIDGVNLTVRLGEFWFFLGPNGAGKSTLIKALLGLLEPQAGQIHLHPQLACREKTGFVPQSSALNPSLPTTVREFVSLGLVGIRAGGKTRAARLNGALEHVGLAGLAGRGYWTLSDGQRQRALVARALIRRPGLLIMDEPTNGLDLAAETALLAYLAKLNREESLTVVCVSHNLATAIRYGSHVALFHGGGVQSGPVRDILTPESVRQVFGIDLPSGKPGEGHSP